MGKIRELLHKRRTEDAKTLDVSDELSDLANNIYSRVHLKRRVGNVTRNQFAKVVQTMDETFEAVTNSRTEVTITLYGSMPLWTTTLGTPEEEAWQREYNEKKVTAILRSIDELTEELFDAAVFVQARLEPTSYASRSQYNCGWVSTKARTPHAINVHANSAETFGTTLWPKIATLFGSNFVFRYSFIHNGTTSVH